MRFRPKKDFRRGGSCPPPEVCHGLRKAAELKLGRRMNSNASTIPTAFSTVNAKEDAKEKSCQRANHDAAESCVGLTTSSRSSQTYEIASNSDAPGDGIFDAF